MNLHQGEFLVAVELRKKHKRAGATAVTSNGVTAMPSPQATALAPDCTLRSAGSQGGQRMIGSESLHAPGVELAGADSRGMISNQGIRRGAVGGRQAEDGVEQNSEGGMDSMLCKNPADGEGGNATYDGLDTLLPGYNSRPNLSTVKVRNADLCYYPLRLQSREHLGMPWNVFGLNSIQQHDIFHTLATKAN